MCIVPIRSFFMYVCLIFDICVVTSVFQLMAHYRLLINFLTPHWMFECLFMILINLFTAETSRSLNCAVHMWKCVSFFNWAHLWTGLTSGLQTNSVWRCWVGGREGGGEDAIIQHLPPFSHFTRLLDFTFPFTPLLISSTVHTRRLPIHPCTPRWITQLHTGRCLQKETSLLYVASDAECFCASESSRHDAKPVDTSAGIKRWVWDAWPLSPFCFSPCNSFSVNTNMTVFPHLPLRVLTRLTPSVSKSAAGG